MTRINSRTKGKIGEREWRDFLKKKLGAEARRGVQYSGNPDAPDVVCNTIFCWEVKRREVLDVYKAMEQVVDDSKGSEKIPAVAWRKNRKDWLIILRGEDLPRIGWQVLQCDKASEGSVDRDRRGE